MYGLFFIGWVWKPKLVLFNTLEMLKINILACILEFAEPKWALIFVIFNLYMRTKKNAKISKFFKQLVFGVRSKCWILKYICCCLSSTLIWQARLVWKWHLGDIEESGKSKKSCVICHNMS